MFSPSVAGPVCGFDKGGDFLFLTLNDGVSHDSVAF